MVGVPPRVFRAKPEEKEGEEEEKCTVCSKCGKKF